MFRGLYGATTLQMGMKTSQSPTYKAFILLLYKNSLQTILTHISWLDYIPTMSQHSKKNSCSRLGVSKLKVRSNDLFGNTFNKSLHTFQN